MSLRRTTAIALASLLALTSCSSADPLTGDSSQADDSIVIGSQAYYSNEIIAEIYALSLEDAGFTVDRQFRIGQREVYLPEIEAGNIDLFPEYTGNLLQYWRPETTARLADDVYSELVTVTPNGLRVLDQSSATDEDAFVVTTQFADQWGLTKISDLANVTEPLTLGGNSELETRSYGPTGLAETYGVTVAFKPIEDGGGPLTVKALTDDEIQVANIYTASPVLAGDTLTVLEDPEGLFLASHVVPLASDDVDDDAAAVINKISAAMTSEDLVTLNVRGVEEQLPASTIAADWLAAEGLR